MILDLFENCSTKYDTWEANGFDSGYGKNLTWEFDGTSLGTICSEA